MRDFKIAKKLTALSLAAVMGLGLAACSGGSGNGDATGTASPTPGTTAEPTSYADQIVVGITAEPKYIEPNAPGMGPAEVQVSQQIFEGLVRTGDDGSIEPVLATDWTISDDGLTYTFNLVQGVKFSNGEDVEPSDWVWSFYRARDYETSNYRYIAEAIESVLAQQTSFGVELVVGEDCSTDRTAAICREYAAKYPDRIRLVTSPENVGWRANYRRTFEACRGKYVAYLDGDDWWCDLRKLQMQADLMESDPGCGMCYTRASNYWQASDRTEPDHPDHYTDFGRLLCSLTIANCATLARRELIARYYDEVRPAEHPEWKTDDAPMWLWFSVRSRISYLPDITAVHRRLPDSVSHSTAYRKRIAFCDSLMDISLWFDARYAAGRNRFRILRRRSSVALWVLSWEGPVGEYVTRWRRDVAACPRLALCPEGPGLLVKKILFRRKKQHL